MQEHCAKVGRVGWRRRVAVVSVVSVVSGLVAVGCGETSRNGGDDPGTTSNTSNTSNTNAATAVSVGGAGGAGGVTSTNVATAVSVGGAGGAGGVTSTEGVVSTTTQAGGGGSGGSAGGGPEPECRSNDDCRLFSDCCTCAAYPATGEAPEACPAADCDQGRCERYGIDQAVCFAGSCIVSTPHSCSPLQVECKSLPPECPDGTLPSVGDDRCWTGDCVPSELCGWLPDCSSCPEDNVCFRGFNDAFGTPYYCMPRPVTCSGEASCDCASQLCEEMGFRSCTDADDGIMQCSP